MKPAHRARRWRKWFGEVTALTLSFTTNAVICACAVTTEEIYTHYRTLGLKPDCSIEIIKRTYRRLVKEWHPDRFHGDQAKTNAANERMKEIIPAYENLIAHHTGNSPKHSARKTDRQPETETVRPDPTEPKAQFEEGRRRKSKGDFERARHWFHQSANQGHVEAMFELGNLFYEGEGVDSDRSEAAYWYRLAGEQGHAEAQFKMGTMRKYGEGILVFYPEALEWFLKAAEQGHAKAQLEAGRLYQFSSHSVWNGVKWQQDHERSAYWLRKAATQGLTEAEFELGHLYEWGGARLEVNLTEAASWYKRAAEHGHEHAQHDLARCYEHGLGVLKDEQEADRWLRKSDWASKLKREAKAGMGASQAKLGRMYETGIGIEKDLVQAVKWYRKAAIWGCRNILFNLANLCATGKGTKKNRTEALKWLIVLNEPTNSTVIDLIQTLKGQMSSKEIQRAKKLAANFVPYFMKRYK